MGLKIYTYSDPYKIDCEPFWDEIKDCAHFCVSQTMVNGLKKIYSTFNNNITTIYRLINSLYENWEDINTNVKQIMEIDNVINELEINDVNSENIKRSLLFNTRSIVSCIRILKELGIESEALLSDNLNIDQKYLIEIYKSIDKSNISAFDFKRVNTLDKIDKSIKRSLLSNNNEICGNNINESKIVIHGIHQFTPSILCAIEDISRYKEVILLFNYQKQYSEVYQTWLNVYSSFKSPMNIYSNNQFIPTLSLKDSYEGNLLGDAIGKLVEKDRSSINHIFSNLEVIEFDNTMEFANYVASIFDQAKKESNKSNFNIAPVAFMKEQFYSASNKVNDILRAYFPEQFGERHFLDYPIGHFFISIINMWDSLNCTIKVEKFSDIKECLNSGMITEKESGQLVSTFNMIEPYIKKERTLIGIERKISDLIKNSRKRHEDKELIGFFNVDSDNLIELRNAIHELNDIIYSFFKDFNEGEDNFRRFYSRVRTFIISKINNMNNLDDEMYKVINSLLMRLEQSDLPGTGTFNGLKQTMSYYLSQDENTIRGAKWIVRGFNQIDGDILRSSTQDINKTCYHFCCLSDKDICSDKDEKLPWPLDIRFFEMSYIPLDWKYQVFLKSKMEYHNFNRYALLYGLEFNRVGVKLSYVRNEDNKDNDLYHMLLLLGVKKVKYSSYDIDSYSEKLVIGDEGTVIDDNLISKLREIDRIKLSICPYKFALESIEQGKTIFRDRFLIHRYMKVIIENSIKDLLSGRTFSDEMLKDEIKRSYEVVESRFKILDELEKTQLISTVYKSLNNFIKKMNQYNKRNNTFPVVNKNIAISREILDFNPKNQYEVLSDSQIKDYIINKKFNCIYSDKCKYCASKDICLSSGDENVEV